MKSHLRAGLIVLASMPIALAAAGSAAAIAAPADPTPSASAVPSPSPSPSPSASASVADTTASPDTPAIADAASARPRTNLTAVFDPIAVPMRDGFGYSYRIRVGVRNSGPRSISLPTGSSAVGFMLTLYWTAPSRSLGGNCEYSPELPPIDGQRPMPARYFCASGPTLRAGETYWQSFVFGGVIFSQYSTDLAIYGYAEDTNPNDNRCRVNDNRCKVAVRLAEPGSGLPVTGTSTIGVAGVGLTLIVAGVIAIWYSRRRRPTQPAGSTPNVSDEQI